MQKVINILALLSFAGTASIVGAGAYVYVQKDAIIENAKKAAMEAATEAVAGALPGMMNSAMPELPGATGGAIGAPAGLGFPGAGGGAPAVTGPAIPF